MNGRRKKKGATDRATELLLPQHRFEFPAPVPLQNNKVDNQTPTREKYTANKERGSDGHLAFYQLYYTVGVSSVREKLLSLC